MASLNDEVQEWGWDKCNSSNRCMLAQVVEVVAYVDGDSARFLRWCEYNMMGAHLPCCEQAAQAALFLRRTDHGSPLWRLLVCIASGKVTREDLRILAEVVEALADG